MRLALRNLFTGLTQRDRALFYAPIVVALVLLLLFAQNREVFASSWRHPLAMLADRSPGARDPGALYSIKPQRLKPVATAPQERVLGITRQRPEIILPDLLPAEEPLNLAMQNPLTIDTPGLGPLTEPFTTPKGPPEIARTTPPTVRLATVSPVPEPTTWLLNILGLAAVGGAMRYRNRRTRDGRARDGSPLPLRG